MLTKQQLQDLSHVIDYCLLDGKERENYANFIELPEVLTAEEICSHARGDYTSDHVFPAMVRLEDLVYDQEQGA